MKIANSEISVFLKNIPTSVKAILIYGPDASLVKLRAEYICKSRNLVGELEGQQVKSNPYLILDKLRSDGLFSFNQNKENIVIVNSSSSVLDKEVATNIDKITQGILLFKAGDLGPDSTLRKFFESHKTASTIACYPDDSNEIQKIALQIFKKHNITIEAPAIHALLNYINTGSRALVINEIELIALFFAEQKSISTKDLDQYLETCSEINFDKLCFAMSSRQAEKSELFLKQLLAEGHTLVSIIRIVARHFFRLYQARSQVETGINEKQAVSSLSPPVFFKQLNNFTQALKLWHTEELINIIDSLNQLEFESKQTNNNSILLFKKLFFDLTKRILN